MKTKTISPLAPPHTINMVHMGMVDRHDIVTIARQTHITQWHLGVHDLTSNRK